MKTRDRQREVGLTAVCLCCALVFTPCRLIEAQQKVIRIGEIVFRGADRPGLGMGREVFRAKLRELGYIDHQNITYETRFADSNYDRFPALAEELAHLNVDVLVASSTPEAIAFKNATKTIPVVFFISTDPVADGLVDRLAQPGGNVTGITSIAPALAGKKLELLKEVVPKLTHVTILLGNPKDSSQSWQESQSAARELRLRAYPVHVIGSDDLESAFKQAKTNSGAVAVMAGSVATTNAKLVTGLATKYRLPAVFDRAEFVTANGLMSYGPDRPELYRRTAVFVDKVIKGMKPSDLPVEQPTKFELVINLKTAKQIGVTIPPNVLARADKVIK